MLHEQCQVALAYLVVVCCDSTCTRMGGGDASIARIVLAKVAATCTKCNPAAEVGARLQDDGLRCTYVISR